MSRLEANQISINYGDQNIIHQLSTIIPNGKITSIIGPNGCGKSTLLKAMSRILPITEGAVLLDGASIHQQPTKEVAREIALLPQSPEVQDGLTVKELVSYGRFPYQKGFGRLTEEDYNIMDWAMRVTHTLDYQERSVNDLSGGQRQRVWIAMALAQKTDIIFLDEPTTYLDIAHQLEVLELVETLNREEDCTIIMVLHDINQAIRFSDHIIAMKEGQIVASGDTGHILTTDLLKTVFQIDAVISTDPITNKPMLLTYSLLKEDVIYE